MIPFSQSCNSLVEPTIQAEHQQIKIEHGTEINGENEKVLNVDESAKIQDFFQDNNAVKIRYMTTRIK